MFLSYSVTAIELPVSIPIHIAFEAFFFGIKVREGRRAADFPKLCVFLNNTVISEDI